MGVTQCRVITRRGRRAVMRTHSKEEPMCPACIESTAVIVAGIGSGGGILAICLGKFRKFVTTTGLGLFQRGKEK